METADLGGLVEWLRDLAPAVDDAERIERIRLMEAAKSALCAAQARESVAFKASQLAVQEAAGVPARRRGDGISAQIALARRESPHKGSRLMGLAEALVNEMPATLAALTSGEISEWRATLVVKATACLSRADRGVADAQLAGRLGSMGDRQVETETKKVAYRLDPRAFTDRLRRAEAERRVTVRPAPDTMAYLTALVPMQQGVAAYAALTRDAATVVANGDQRTRGQVTADLLVERVTGQVAVDTVPVEVQLVISDQTLAGASDEPGHLAGYGPVPAPWARDLVRDSAAQVWVRRLYADHGRLVAMESTRRRFPKGLRRFIVARDQTCRTPWCDAPIRHLDHAVPVDADGPTSETNGQGLCEACNHTKQALGWRARPGPAGASQVVTLTTPTGHEYESRPPSRSPRSSLLETYFGQAIELHVA